MLEEQAQDKAAREEAVPQSQGGAGFKRKEQASSFGRRVGGGGSPPADALSPSELDEDLFTSSESQ